MFVVSSVLPVNKKNGWPVSRVLYISLLYQKTKLIPTAIHLTKPLPACSCDLPLDEVETLRQENPDTPSLVLHQIGLALTLTVTGSAVGSYPAFSTLPKHALAVIFCGAFPRISPAGRYPVSCFHEARTFLTFRFYFPKRDCPATRKVIYTKFISNARFFYSKCKGVNDILINLSL